MKHPQTLLYGSMCLTLTIAMSEFPPYFSKIYSAELSSALVF